VHGKTSFEPQLDLLPRDLALVVGQDARPGFGDGNAGQLVRGITDVIVTCFLIHRFARSWKQTFSIIERYSDQVGRSGGRGCEATLKSMLW
jgi:hypothetical protein